MTFCGAKDYIAPFSTITAIGTAVWHKLFPSETYAAFPAMTGFNVNFCFINKFHKYCPRSPLAQDNSTCRYRRASLRG
jgi:positive regulator of sigma E activity